MSKSDLVYTLIFSNQDSHVINIANYIDSKVIYKYDRFIKEIKSILLESKVEIVKEILFVNSTTEILWKIKTKKLKQNVEI